MKGKRYTTEDKIRIFRAVDSGQAILDVCREHNLSEVRFHRWKRQFGQMEINEARRLKELERENSELKKMLAESLLKNRVLEFVCKKTLRPGQRRDLAQHVVAAQLCSGRSATHFPPRTTAPTLAGVVRTTFPVRRSADCGLTPPGRLGGG